jgi:D-aminoacyl-tRNA deacylase
MRAVIQRVSQAQVTIEGKVVGKINAGLMILLGVSNEDTTEDADWLVQKIIQLRIFNDSEQKMNLSIQEIGGDVLLVSQFTLFASTKKGNRPSFIQSAKPDIAIPLYEYVIAAFEKQLAKKIQTGVFGAMMNVGLENNGPVTIIIDTKNKE